MESEAELLRKERRQQREEDMRLRRVELQRRAADVALAAYAHAAGDPQLRESARNVLVAYLDESHKALNWK